jgi:hypothetical protein
MARLGHDVMPIPKSVRGRGNALERILQSLLNQGFVEEVPVGLADDAWRSGDDGRFGLRITVAGLRAIGVPALESALGDDQAAATREQKPPRPGSKLAKLITMLMQPGGRSIDELSEALGWEVHTVRAAITGLRKGGHVIVRAKNDAGVSLYRIEPAADA